MIVNKNKLQHSFTVDTQAINQSLLKVIVTKATIDFFLMARYIERRNNRQRTRHFQASVLHG